MWVPIQLDRIIGIVYYSILCQREFVVDMCIRTTTLLKWEYLKKEIIKYSSNRKRCLRLVLVTCMSVWRWLPGHASLNHTFPTTVSRSNPRVGIWGVRWTKWFRKQIGLTTVPTTSVFPCTLALHLCFTSVCHQELAQHIHLRPQYRGT
jgi:hypothetical protein